MKKFRKLVSIVTMLALISMSCVFVSADLSVPSKPANDHFVDHENILSTDTEEKIEAANETLAGTAEIFVVAVASTADATAQDYANEIFTKWAIGGATQQRGVLLLINSGSVNSSENTYYSIIGGGVSKEFENGALKTILSSNIEPYFSAGDYDSSVQNFINTCVTKIQASSTVVNPGATATPEKAEGNSIFNAIWGFFKVVLIIALIVIVIVIILLIILNINAKNNKKKRQQQGRPSGRKLRPQSPENNQYLSEEQAQVNDEQNKKETREFYSDEEVDQAYYPENDNIDFDNSTKSFDSDNDFEDYDSFDDIDSN